MIRRTSCAIPLSLLLFPVNAVAEDAVDLAARLIGRPYVWGAEGPDSFDCSGLTQYVYREAGVSLPRRAISQSKSGDPARRLRRGDLLFFSTDERKSLVTHVGIYEGGGLMIEASKRYGRVRRDALNDSYWVDRFMFARRVTEGLITVRDSRRAPENPRRLPDKRKAAIRVLEGIAGVLLKRPR